MHTVNIRVQNACVPTGTEREQELSLIECHTQAILYWQQVEAAATLKCHCRGMITAKKVLVEVAFWLWSPLIQFTTEIISHSLEVDCD